MGRKKFIVSNFEFETFGWSELDGEFALFDGKLLGQKVWEFKKKFDYEREPFWAIDKSDVISVVVPKFKAKKGTWALYSYSKSD